MLLLLSDLNLYAPVAQPDRVTGYEPVGRGFESLPARDNCMTIGEKLSFLAYLLSNQDFSLLRNCFLRIIL